MLMFGGVGQFAGCRLVGCCVSRLWLMPLCVVVVLAFWVCGWCFADSLVWVCGVFLACCVSCRLV